MHHGGERECWGGEMIKKWRKREEGRGSSKRKRRKMRRNMEEEKIVSGKRKGDKKNGKVREGSENYKEDYRTDRRIMNR